MSIMYEPYINMPFLEANPTPQKYANGTDINIEHGQDIANTPSALYIQNVKPKLPNIGAIISINGGKNAINTDINITIGVYIFANFFMNFSLFVFLSKDFSTTSTILCATLPLNGLVTLMVIGAL